MGRRADRPADRRDDRRLVRDDPGDGGRGRADAPADARRRWRAGPPLRRRDRVGLPVAALVRVVAHAGCSQSGEVCLGDLGLTHQERLARFGDLAALLRDARPRRARAPARRAARARVATAARSSTCSTRPRERCSTRTRRATGAASCNAAHDLRPDVAILAAAGRGNVDGEPVQGSLAEFVARQAWLVKAPKVVLSHHDDWLPGFSVATDVGADPRAAGAPGAPHRARRARLPRRSRAVRLNRGSGREQRVDPRVVVAGLGEDLARGASPRGTGPERIDVGVPAMVTGWRSTWTGLPSLPSTTWSKARCSTCGSANTASSE